MTQPQLAIVGLLTVSAWWFISYCIGVEPLDLLFGLMIFVAMLVFVYWSYVFIGMAVVGIFK